MVHGMMSGWGMGWFGGFFMILFWILVIAGLILLIKWIIQHTKSGADSIHSSHSRALRNVMLEERSTSRSFWKRKVI
jgi:putative membrane protein